MSETENTAWSDFYDGEVTKAYMTGERPLDFEVVGEMLKMLDQKLTQEAQHRKLALKKERAQRNEQILGTLSGFKSAGAGAVKKLQKGQLKGRGTALRLRLLILALDEAIDLSLYSPALAFAAEHYRQNPIPQQQDGWLPRKVRTQQESAEAQQ